MKLAFFLFARRRGAVPRIAVRNDAFSAQIVGPKALRRVFRATGVARCGQLPKT
jgi:hypothetical protein